MRFFYYLGVFPDFDPSHSLVTSPFFSPFALGIIRSTLALYSLLTIIVHLGIGCEEQQQTSCSEFFSYFTDLSYVGLCAYYCASAVQTVAYAYARQQITHEENRHGYPLQRWPRILQFLHVLLLSSFVGFAPLITIVYWAALSSGSFLDEYSSWSNISMHALNSVFAIAEALLTNIQPLPWIHLPFLIVILALYLGLAYLTYATQHVYVYFFLDPQKEHAALAGWIIGILVAEVVSFTVMHGVIKLRKYFVGKYFGGNLYDSAELNQEKSRWTTNETVQTVELEA